MAITYAPRRGDPDAIAPRSIRGQAVLLVVQAARELIDGGADGANRISAEDLPRWNRLREAVRVLDTLEGRK